MKTILDEAKEIIYGDREKTYGTPGKNLNTIATYWTAHLHSRGLLPADCVLTVLDVTSMMALLKLARLGNSPTHRDSMVDACGYLALADRVLNEGEAP